MASGIELAFFLIELKIASTRLNNLATSLDSNRIQFSFSKSQSELNTAGHMTPPYLNALRRA